MPLLFSLIFFFVAAASGGSSLVPGSSGQTIPQNLVTQTACYRVEENVKITVDPTKLESDSCRTQVDSKTYLRLRQNIKIVDSKIGEGAPYTGGCQTDVSRLRQIGTLADGRQIWWLDESYQKNDLKDFLLVFLKAEKGYHFFDVYIDEQLKDKIPDFVKNCKETGGLVPVMENPATPTFPPQAISVKTDPEFNKDCCQDNYNKYSADLAPWYLRMEEQISLPPQAEKIGIYTKKIGQETRTYEVLFHSGTVWLKDQATQTTYFYNASQDNPFQSIPHNPTLQLSALKFITTSEWTWATPECKPALYLYPESPTQLSVKLNPQGKLTQTIPEYQDGWNNLTAYPSGEIQYQGNSYPYLYYEAEIEKVKVPKTGWVVAKNELARLFNQVLPQLGLNPKEAQEFADFWLANLTSQSAPYFFVGVLPREEIEQIEPISFSQPPQTFIRVRLYFEPLQSPVSAESPTLPSPPARQGFTAVDWGGILHSGSCQDGVAQNQIVK